MPYHSLQAMVDSERLFHLEECGQHRMKQITACWSVLNCFFYFSRSAGVVVFVGMCVGVEHPISALPEGVLGA